MLYTNKQFPTFEDSLLTPTALDAVHVEQAVTGQETEVLNFLARRPIYTVAMMSLIRDNGVVSALNRGTFHVCRDTNGSIEGVALVAHATLTETVSDRALQALAEVAQNCSNTHMIMGEQDRLSEFWIHYSEAGHESRLASREWLLELQWPVEAHKPVPTLRVATANELDLVIPVQAQLAFDESGVDPSKVDPEGFRKRCLRRINQGRTWVLVEDGALVFKADIVAQAPEAIYLEGIWLREDRRTTGFGVSCMSELSQVLLSDAKSICLLVNEANERAKAFYRKCGFLFRATYETIFLPQKENFPYLT